jgi:hypothetical protein
VIPRYFSLLDALIQTADLATTYTLGRLEATGWSKCRNCAHGFSVQAPCPKTRRVCQATELPHRKIDPCWDSACAKVQLSPSRGSKNSTDCQEEHTTQTASAVLKSLREHNQSGVKLVSDAAIRNMFQRTQDAIVCAGLNYLIGRLGRLQRKCELMQRNGRKEISSNKNSKASNLC